MEKKATPFVVSKWLEYDSTDLPQLGRRNLWMFYFSPNLSLLTALAHVCSLNSLDFNVISSSPFEF